MTTLLKVSSVNQITLPKSLRKKLGIGPGDEVEVEATYDVITIRKAETNQEKVDRLLRELDEMNQKAESKMTPEQRAFRKMSAGWTVNQYHEYFDNTPEHKTYLKEKYGV